MIVKVPKRTGKCVNSCFVMAVGVCNIYGVLKASV